MIYFFILLAFIFSAQPANAQRDLIIIRQVNIIEVETGNMRENQDVLIEDTRIKKIAPGMQVPRKAIAIDGRGKYLIPGLIDFDASITNRESKKEPGLILMLAHGVTTVRDRGPVMSTDYCIDLKMKIERGEKAGPRLWLISPYIGTKSRLEKKIDVTTVEEAVAAVDSVAKYIDVIRADNSLSLELLQAIVKRAKQFEKPVVSRITSPFTDASEAGLDMIDHASELRRNTSVNRQLFFDFSKQVINGNASREEQYNNVLPELGGTDTAYFIKTVETMKRNNTWLCISPSSYMPSVIRFELNDSGRYAYKSKRQMDLLRKTRESYSKITDLERYKSFVDLKEIKWAHDLGLKMVIGSSMGEIHTPGLGMHDSFYWLKLNGFTPSEILKMATINTAVFMKKDDQIGQIKEGYLADLVLLDANPLHDIENAKKINALIVNGKLYKRKDLDQMLEDAKTTANPIN